MNEQEKYDWMVYVSCMTFNHSPYIVDAMNGFTMQETNFPFVCAIVDDASTDGEQEVIKKYLNEHFDLEDKSIARHEETDDYVLSFARHKTNLNCHFAVFYLKYNHYSIKKSKLPYLVQWRDRAKYIALCEGDDYWIHPKKLQMQVDAMLHNPRNTLCHTGFNYFYENWKQERSGQEHVDRNLQYLQSGEDVIYQILNGNRYRIQTMTVLYTSRIWADAMRNRPKEWKMFKMGDTPLWIQLLEKGNICFIPEITAVYRIHDNSACRPESIEKHLRFVLSSGEMRVMLGEYIHLDKDKMKVLYKSYLHNLQEYLYFNPSYVPSVTPQFNNGLENILFRVKTSFLCRPFMRFLLLMKRHAVQIRKNLKHY